MMEKIWWERIPNAERLIQDVVFTLLAGKQAFLQIERHLPWPVAFQNVLETAIQHQDGVRRLHIVSAKEIGTEDDALETYLLCHFCKSELRDEFRPGFGYARFLAQRCDTSTLKDSYLIIDGGTERQVNRWLTFLSEYSRQLGKKRGISCLILSSTLKKDNWHGITTFCYEEYLTDYDSFIFFMIVADAQAIPKKLKPYLGEFVITLVGSDVELGFACLIHGCDFLENASEILKSISETEFYSDGSKIINIPRKETVQAAWWMAQVKLLFPKIEAFRQDLLERHREEIEKVLPCTNAEGDVIQDYHEVELGLLWHMRNHDRLHLVLHSREDDDLRRYRMLRNRLAHINPLSLQEIKKYVLES